MGGSSVDGKDAEFIQSVGEMFGRFSGEVVPKLLEWEQRLKDDPAELESIEFDVQHTFQRGAGLVVAGLISVVMQTPEFAAAAEQTRRTYSTPLAKGRDRTMAMKLWGE